MAKFGSLLAVSAAKGVAVLGAGQERSGEGLCAQYFPTGPTEGEGPGGRVCMPSGAQASFSTSRAKGWFEPGGPSLRCCSRAEALALEAPAHGHAPHSFAREVGRGSLQGPSDKQAVDTGCTGS